MADHPTDGPSGAPTDQELRERLSDLEYQVTQCSATERAFTGRYWDCHDDGTYHCIVCGAMLFDSGTKFDSGTGWPSFFDAVDSTAVATKVDTTHGMVRTEAVCASCGAHLGHIFEDGPRPTGLRYCMNSASLDLRPRD